MVSPALVLVVAANNEMMRTNLRGLNIIMQLTCEQCEGGDISKIVRTRRVQDSDMTNKRDGEFF